MTTSTTTRPVAPYPEPEPGVGAVLAALELVFSDPLELLSRALTLDLENNDGVPRVLNSSGSWAARGVATSSLLHSWCEALRGARLVSAGRFHEVLRQVPTLAPTQNLAEILDALEPAVAKLPDTTGLRPLQSVLEALEELQVSCSQG